MFRFQTISLLKLVQVVLSNRFTRFRAVLFQNPSLTTHKFIFCRYCNRSSRISARDGSKPASIFAHRSFVVDGSLGFNIQRFSSHPVNVNSDSLLGQMTATFFVHAPVSGFVCWQNLIIQDSKKFNSPDRLLILADLVF